MICSDSVVPDSRRVGDIILPTIESLSHFIDVHRPSMTKILPLVLLLSSLSSSILSAQGEQEEKKERIQSTPVLNIGVGFSGWGIPVYASCEFSAGKNFNIGVGGSYQSSSESYTGSLYASRWTHTIIGLSVSGKYYVNDVLKIPSEFDLYGGAALGYYLWKTELVDSESNRSDVYSGPGSGGFGIGLLIGGRYYFSDNLALNVEVGGNTVMASGGIGLSVAL